MINGLSVTPKVILDEFEVRFAKSQNETERLMHLLSMRVFLVAALMDEGWEVGSSYFGGHKSYVGMEHEWPGTISDMPQEIYDELKGRLK